MFSRKGVFVALTVFAMLAMLVPVAVAAPDVVSSVTITAPTEANPVLLDPPASFVISYTITVSGSQVHPVIVTFDLINEYGVKVDTETITKAPGTLVPGVNNLTHTFTVEADLPEGFYNVQVCIDDGIDPYCALQRRAVRLDNTPPVVEIERPADNDVCTWVTGNQYELFGMATDNVAVSSAWFQYTTDPAFTPIKIGNENAAGLGQNATAVAGFPGEFWAKWDSSRVPDGTGFIQFCAKDSAGMTTCSEWIAVCIENRVKVDLEKGWNLISTPLVLYDDSITSVLKNVWNPLDSTVWATAPIDQIVTTRDGGVNWLSWMAGNPAPALTTFEDGYGYWVHAVAPATIEFVGTWLSIGPVAPPEYAVDEGWNLIGYTHWGQPTMGPWPAFNKTVTDYLGYPMMWSVEAMWRYNAQAGYYVAVDELTGEQFMRQGSGYWLALAEGTEGTINP